MDYPVGYIGVKLTYNVDPKRLTTEKEREISIIIDKCISEINGSLVARHPDYARVEYIKRYSTGSIIVDIFTILASPVISAPLNAYALYTLFFKKNKEVVRLRLRNEPRIGNIPILNLASKLQTEPFGDDVSFVLSIAASADVKTKLKENKIDFQDETVRYNHPPKITKGIDRKI